MQFETENTQIMVLWDVMPHSLVDRYQSFIETSHLQLMEL